MTDRDEHFRRRAIEIHSRDADWFAAEYATGDDSYDTSFRCGRRMLSAHMDRVVAALPPAARVLDVGCGTGELVERLRARGVDAIGVEPSAAMRGHALRSLPADAVIDGTVLELPFPDRSFDAVFAIEVFRYLPLEDTRRGFREIARVLRPGGVFFGTFVNLLAADGYVGLTALRRVRSSLFGVELDHHTQFERPATLDRKLRSAGFADVTVEGAMFAPLRLLYKAAPRLAARVAPVVGRLDPWLARRPFHGFAAHLVAEARR